MEKELRARKVSELLGLLLLFFMVLLLLFSHFAERLTVANGMVRLAVLTAVKALFLLLPTLLARLVMKKQNIHMPEMKKRGHLSNHLLGASSVGFIVAVQVLYGAVFPTTLSTMGVTKETTAVEYILLFLLYVLLPAVLEELFFRHTVLHSLLYQSGALALLVSALAFGLMHFSTAAFPIAFFGGLVLGSAYLATVSWQTVVCVHLMCNATWFAAEIVRVNALSERGFMQTVFTVAVILAAVGIPTLRSTLSAILSEGDGERPSASSFWTVPVIVFFILAVAAQVLLGGII